MGVSLTLNITVDMVRVEPGGNTARYYLCIREISDSVTAPGREKQGRLHKNFEY